MFVSREKKFLSFLVKTGALTPTLYLPTRVNQVLRCATPYAKSTPLYSFQGHCSTSSLVGMEMKRRRKVDLRMWRPVSTQAASFEEDVTVVVEDGGKSDEVMTVTDEVSNSIISSSAPDGEKHSLSLEVGACLFRFIRGKGGSMQKEIEEKMGVKIIFPSSKKEETITIEGVSVDSVTRASEKIQTIIDEAVKNPNLDYSHFISLPLAIHPELVDKLASFQNFVLGNSDALVEENIEDDSSGDASNNRNKDQKIDEGRDVAVELEDDKHVTGIPIVSYAPKVSKSPSLSDLRIDRSIFIKPKTFHLTLLMLKLWNKERVNAASEVLQSISSKVMDALDNRPIYIRLKGLDCMRGSMAKASVLYATVEEIGNEGRLLRAAQVITDAFIEAGLVLEKDANHKLKLHATVMNARHRKGKRNRKNDSFDARGIFKQFGSEEWGEYLIHEAHLSQRFAFDENGYYHCCASIPFPGSMQGD